MIPDGNRLVVFKLVVCQTRVGVSICFAIQARSASECIFRHSWFTRWRVGLVFKFVTQTLAKLVASALKANECEKAQTHD